MKTIYLILLVLFSGVSISFAESVSNVQSPVEDKVSSTGQFELSSPVFANNGVIPVKYTCRGTDINPPLTIKNVPPNTKSMVLSMTDPQGIAGTWVHWIVFNIKPTKTSIGENEVPGIEALNDFGNFYYGGPCTADETEHNYIFTLYALNTFLADVTEGSTLDTLKKEMEGKIIAKSELVGTYVNSQN